MNQIIAEYCEATKRRLQDMPCNDCSNAIWQHMAHDEQAEKLAYDYANGHAILCHCKSTNTHITSRVYSCNDCANADQEAKDFLGG